MNGILGEFFLKKKVLNFNLKTIFFFFEKTSMSHFAGRCECKESTILGMTMSERPLGTSFTCAAGLAAEKGQLRGL